MSHFVFCSCRFETGLEFGHDEPSGFASSRLLKVIVVQHHIERCAFARMVMTLPRVAICAVARTPIGKLMGTLSNFSAVELGILSVKELCNRMQLNLKSGIVDEVIFGQVLQAGAGQNPARQVALGAGLPVSTPCMTLNKVCGSSLKAAMTAANSIRSGEYNVIIAGGMESMTNAPQLMMGQRGDEKMGNSKLIDSMIHDGLWDVYDDIHMGHTGETVAQECSITRQESDDFAAKSQQKAATAWENGWFDWETFSIEVPQGKGAPIQFSQDEGVRAGTTAESLANLRPVFNKEGQVTAGNASTINDGASAILLANAEFAEQQGWEIIAYVEDYVTSGVEPSRVMSAPIPAVKDLLERNNLQVLDVDIYEHNEAFASASCAVAKEVGIPHDRFNLHGGAVALGHPLGSSGTRCLITMLGVMRRTGGKSGIVTLCLGGGNAVAMLVRTE